MTVQENYSKMQIYFLQMPKTVSPTKSFQQRLNLIVVELPADDELLCQICYDEVERQHIIGGICGHYFCKDCYKQYAQVKIQSDGKKGHTVRIITLL